MLAGHIVRFSPNSSVNHTRSLPSIISEPDGSLGIDRDAVRIAFWGGSRIFYQRVRAWVEETDSTGAKLGEPEVPTHIEDQVKGRTAFPQVPLVPALVLRIKFTDGITAGLGKPDIPIRIYHDKQWA